MANSGGTGMDASANATNVRTTAVPPTEKLAATTVSTATATQLQGLGGYIATQDSDFNSAFTSDAFGCSPHTVGDMHSVQSMRPRCMSRDGSANELWGDWDDEPDSQVALHSRDPFLDESDDEDDGRRTLWYEEITPMDILLRDGITVVERLGRAPLHNFRETGEDWDKATLNSVLDVALSVFEFSQASGRAPSEPFFSDELFDNGTSSRKIKESSFPLAGSAGAALLNRLGPAR